MGLLLVRAAETSLSDRQRLMALLDAVRRWGSYGEAVEERLTGLADALMAEGVATVGSSPRRRRRPIPAVGHNYREL